MTKIYGNVVWDGVCPTPHPLHADRHRVLRGPDGDSGLRSRQCGFCFPHTAALASMSPSASIISKTEEWNRNNDKYHNSSNNSNYRSGTNFNNHNHRQGDASAAAGSSGCSCGQPVSDHPERKTLSLRRGRHRVNLSLPQIHQIFLFFLQSSP